MTQIHMIAPASQDPVAQRRHRELASALTANGHAVSALVPRDGARARRRPVLPPDGTPRAIPVDLPPLGRAVPALLDTLLRRRLSAALRGAGLSRPDVVVVSAVDASVILARLLSVLHGVPYVLLVHDRSVLLAPRADRFEQLLAQSVQEASAAAATSAELADRLRARFTLPSVGTHPGHAGPELARTAELLCARAEEIARGRRIVFHAPYPLDPAPRSASRRRPNQMLAAFAANGHQVHRITGYPFQRSLAHRDLRRRVAAGARIDFLYSENSTQPNLLATSFRKGFAPLLEARILAYCDRRGIPTGQFYRDVYWRFAESQASVPQPRRALMQLAYRADLAVLRRSRAHLFLPSLPMASIVPFEEERCTALPPGAPVHESPSPAGLRLLYVGGIGAGYALDEGLRALQDVEDATLTMVVRREEWEAHRERYAPLLTDRVRVVHAGSDELQEFYDEASACLLLVAPDGYRRFAVPLKLFEYLGYGKPTLASQDTLAGDLVEQMGSGFTVPNARREIAALLRRLQDEPSLLEGAARGARAARLENTWAMRARTVEETLTGRRDA